MKSGGLECMLEDDLPVAPAVLITGNKNRVASSLLAYIFVRLDVNTFAGSDWSADHVFGTSRRIPVPPRSSDRTPREYYFSFFFYPLPSPIEFSWLGDAYKPSLYRWNIDRLNKANTDGRNREYGRWGHPPYEYVTYEAVVRVRLSTKHIPIGYGIGWRRWFAFAMFLYPGLLQFIALGHRRQFSRAPCKYGYRW